MLRLRIPAVLGLVLALVPPLVAEAHTPAPSEWPATNSTQPQMEGWPNALRLSGNNRYQTGLAASLTLHGTGHDESYPFGNPDPATDEGWWGLNSCPRAIIVVAGDSPADALAASVLSDPSGESTEPYLPRSAAADPLFFPLGGFARVDTDFAPILVTKSAREGANALDVATRLAANDLRNGECTAARQAIVVGGTRALASTIDTELVSIGYEEVFRIAGSSRYATARLIGEALGTKAFPSGITENSCNDVDVSDGSARTDFYANSIVEYRASATQCRLLARTAVLADGLYGIDALAAGWWTSYWQVPILLHDGTGDLPRQTSEALETLNVDNLIILGGTSRISDAVADEAKATAGANTVIRISGPDRYATSVEMAKRFGGWWPGESGEDFEGSVLCVAASSGGSATSVGAGWPDALSAGPWCARAAAANTGSPVRALAPTTGDEPATTDDAGSLLRPARAMVPVLLVPAAASALPTAVADFLSAAFDDSDNWCSSRANSPSCLLPGFAVVFGGRAVITDALAATLSETLAGGDAAAASNPTPTGDDFFATTLDLSPVYDDEFAGEGPDDQRVCVPRGGYEDARWLMAEAGETTSLDLMTRGRDVDDADSESRSTDTGSPACVEVVAQTADEVVASLVSLTGIFGSAQHTATFSLDSDDWLFLDDAITEAAPSDSNGVDSTDDSSDGGDSAWTFTTTSTPVNADSRGESADLDEAELEITLTRGENRSSRLGPDTFEATFTLHTSEGTITGTAEGEAIFDGTTWHFRGVATFDGGTWNIDSGEGGFRADIAVGVATGLADDAISWRLDGVVG
ncbi:MAG: cell wall-binding repeat-containing protein [Ilumatobacteraceae bacterium]